jgi:TRAP-type C4-dicarboxylate transport system permease small subunit
MSALKKFYDRINTTLTVVMASFLIIATLAIGLQVFTRYVLNFTPPWTEELARYSNIWITMLGIGAVLRRKGHIKLDFLETVLTEKGKLKSKLALDMINTTVTTIFLTFLVYGGFKILKAAARQTAPGLQISLVAIYIAVPIGSLFALLFIIEQIVNSILRKREQIE